MDSAAIQIVSSRTPRAEIDLETADGRLRPGENGSARISVGESGGVLSIPLSLIIERRQDNPATCYLVDDGEPEIILIKLDEDSRTRVEVIDGLKYGDSVIEASGHQDHRWGEDQASEQDIVEGLTTPT